MNIDWNRTQAKTTIEHLTVRYRGAVENMNATALRLRLERLLDNVDLQPPGLSSGAVLIVREIQGLSPLSTTALARSTQPEREKWTEQVRNQMASLYAAAARPALRPVPSNANTVLFADPAEMLTCLTRDIVNGQAWQRWYWQRLLTFVPRFPAAALTLLWSNQATFVPAVFSMLQPTETFTAITLLAPHELQQVTHALHHSFDLPSTMLTELRRNIAAHSFPSLPDKPEKLTRSSSPSSQTFDAFNNVDGAEKQTAPPWQRWFPDLSQAIISVEAHYLLGLGLTLYHAPTFARSTHFTSQTTAWLRTYRDVSAAQKRAQARNNPSTSSTANATSPRSGASYRVVIGLAPIMQEMPPMQEMPTQETPMQEMPTQETPMQEMPTQETLTLMQEMPTQEAPTSTSASTNAPAKPVTREFEFATAKSLPSDGVTTHLGGILYLINLLPLLRPPTTEAEEDMFSDYLSGWGMIEALARELLGTLYDHYANDPIWGILASLDGRDAGVETPPRRSLIHYALSSPASPASAGGNELGPYVARLLGEPELEMSEVAKMVLCKYGRVIVSRTHVDLYMSMEEISIPVRRAGLDRDPGWVPDLARIVLFHFD